MKPSHLPVNLHRVALMVSAGFTDKEIAKAVGCTQKAASNQVCSARHRLGIGSRIGLAKAIHAEETESLRHKVRVYEGALSRVRGLGMAHSGLLAEHVTLIVDKALLEAQCIL